MVHWFVESLRNNPSLAIFLTLGLGFLIGQLKYKTFSLGNVTSVLLVGVLVGQLDIPIPGPIKNAFFLLFLFAIGYSVGPQFFHALRGDGIKQVLFACVLCVLCLLTTWVVALIMHYDIGEALGLLAGSQTMSAILGVGTDTMNSVSATAAEKKAWVDIMPVCYAVTYVYGTIGSAYLLANVGPAMLGGLKKVKAETAELERQMNQGSAFSDPNYINALRPVAFRAYKVEADFFDTPKSIDEVESYLKDQGRRLFVERVRQNGKVTEISPEVKIAKGDEIVLSGRRQYIIGDEKWIGTEVNDAELLSFPAEQMQVTISRKGAGGKTVDQIRAMKEMYGVSIKSITRGGASIPVLSQVQVHPGDVMTIVGLQTEVAAASSALGYADKQSDKSDLILVGLGIFIGGIIGLLTIHFGKVPVSLSTSGGALIAGLFFGWLRSRRPTWGHIPSPAVWLFNNLGLNMFIAVIGINSGPSFVSGLQEVGWLLFVMGAVCTSVPLLLGVIIGKKIFKFPAAINLGCCAGSRTTTASLGAIQDAIGSSIPAMGYTVTYAIGNTLLILWGVVIVLLMS
ncbi:aspartate-alanine antiporter [uncultured Duncaniella sp.]|uniref:aspartate-alanine antiporter n=1 Tax=uncultured Duncaniella sp. TaxID=2768039 RepID=UPI002674B59C|nr:aspartate-alanine antiporter [uncultured Duncaniella sp.]MCI9173242.1 aspartate-alanine antiporter [Muribaculaceae bacterium]